MLGGYFLSGRSPASRDRALKLVDGELVVGPLSPGKHDPLRHYAAATTAGDWLVLGNGEQVSRAAQRLHARASPTEALSGFAYEPDPPVRTSRILAVQDLEPGEAVLLTTYESDGEQVSVAAPFTEATVGAGTREELLDEYVGESDGQQVVSTTGKAAYVP